MERKYILVHYSELSLKKGNRQFFEKRLIRNLKKSFDDIDNVQVKQHFGRFTLVVPGDLDDDLLRERMDAVLGLSSYSIAYPGDLNLELLAPQILKRLEEYEFDSFRVETKRSDKRYPLNSMDINRQIGAEVFMKMNKKVDLKNPELIVNIEIFDNQLYYFFEKHPGIIGLPSGTSGKVLSMLSSGIDSPVSSYLMMTRGCSVQFVHFHSFPFTEKTSYYNALTLAKKLTKFQYRSKVHLVPLAKIQEQIILKAPAKLRIILYRRMMFRLAEKIAYREKCQALVTGESLGQVASQTLENITAASEIVTMPIFRPLVGMHKQQIMDIANEIDTFETSIEPYDDCCSYLQPPNPETKAKLDQVHAAELEMAGFEDILSDALKETEVKKYSFP